MCGSSNVIMRKLGGVLGVGTAPLVWQVVSTQFSPMFHSHALENARKSKAFWHFHEYRNGTSGKD